MKSKLLNHKKSEYKLNDKSKKKNIFVINLPFKHPIIRRYSCSYYAQGFLYPPQELLRIATILELDKDNRVYFIDSIAENLKINELIKILIKNKPVEIYTILSIEFIDIDLKQLLYIKKKLKENSINTKIKILSYIATFIPGYFKKHGLEIINEIKINKLAINNQNKQIKNIKQKNKLKDKILLINSQINYEDNIIQSLKISKKEIGKRLKDNYYNNIKFPNTIKQVDRKFIKNYNYNEIFTKGKTAFLYFGFGCDFNCIYCVHSFCLNKYLLRNKQNIFDEILNLYKQGYKNIRILDDNFTINKEFLKELTKFIVTNKIKLNFYGLSRIDLLDDDTIYLLKKINVKRVYIGLETINSKMQKYYNKNINLSFKEIRRRINLLKQNKIETAVWILYHPLKQTKKELFNELKKFRKLNIDLINLSVLTPYPGTELFYKEKDNLDFNYIPFKSRYKNINYNQIKTIELKFFILSFLRLNSLKLFIKHPISSFHIFFDLIKKTLIKRDNNKRIDFI